MGGCYCSAPISTLELYPDKSALNAPSALLTRPQPRPQPHPQTHPQRALKRALKRALDIPNAPSARAQTALLIAPGR
jgi:hypothetical protein